MSDDQQSGQSHKEQPIIIKKVKKGGHGGHHGGAWKVAYADFVTAMMAFFIVMWILASSQEVKESVSSYFQDPGAFEYKTGKGSPVKIEIMPKKPGDGPGQGGGPGSGAAASGASGPMQISFSNGQMDTLSTKVTEKLKAQAKYDSIKASEKIKSMGEQLKKDFVSEMARRPEMKDILSSIKIEMTKEGLRIELIESKDALFFQVGSAKLSNAAIDVLKKLGERIGEFPNNVEIEGHTDARQYGKSASYTNWELSNDRANSARRALSKYFWAGQIDKVAGFADRKLRNPDNPFDISNRRVSILIKQLSASDFLKDSQKKLEGEDKHE
jgi:chemotaxis protein MotB